MKYNNTEHAGAALDWTMAQALEGKTVEAQLYQMRAKFEPRLIADQDEVNTKRAALDQLRESAQAAPQADCDSKVCLKDLMIKAAVILSIFNGELRRTLQIVIAYGLRHGLLRQPAAPQIFENACQLGFFVALEAVLNAGFLNNAYMVAGPLQALMAAAQISFTNVAASTTGGYLIGRRLSYGMHSADPDDPYFKRWRRLAQILTFGFVCGIAFFHLSVGLIRAQETLHGIEHSLARYAEILTTPEALFLVIVGIVMSCMSWKKGMTAFDDPYPGYGDRQHAVEQIKDQMEDAIENLQDQVAARFDEKLRVLIDTEKAARKNRKAYNRAVDDYLKSVRALDCKIKKAESDLRAQVAQVAHHHRAARDGYSPPIPDGALESLTRFDSYRINDPVAFLPAPDFSAARARLEDAKAEALERLTSIYERACKDIDGDEP